MSATRPKPPTLKQMTRTVDTFNANLPVGSAVEYRSWPHSTPKLTTVRAAAFILGGHTPCAFVEGVTGCVALFALRAPSAKPQASRSSENTHVPPPDLSWDCVRCDEGKV